MWISISGVFRLKVSDFFSFMHTEYSTELAFYDDYSHNLELYTIIVPKYSQAMCCESATIVHITLSRNYSSIRNDGYYYLIRTCGLATRTH